MIHQKRSGLRHASGTIGYGLTLKRNPLLFNQQPYDRNVIITTATQATETAKRLHELSQNDRDLISTIGRAATATLQVHRALMERPIATSGHIVTQTGISPATVNKSLKRPKELELVEDDISKAQPNLLLSSLFLEQQ